VGGGRR